MGGNVCRYAPPRYRRSSSASTCEIGPPPEVGGATVATTVVEALVGALVGAGFAAAVVVAAAAVVAGAVVVVVSAVVVAAAAAVVELLALSNAAGAEVTSRAAALVVAGSTICADAFAVVAADSVAVVDFVDDRLNTAEPRPTTTTTAAAAATGASQRLLLPVCAACADRAVSIERTVATEGAVAVGSVPARAAEMARSQASASLPTGARTAVTAGRSCSTRARISGDESTWARSAGVTSLSRYALANSHASSETGGGRALGGRGTSLMGLSLTLVGSRLVPGFGRYCRPIVGFVGAVVGGEGSSEGHSAPSDARPYRARWNLQHLGNLGVIEIGNVAKHHGSPEIVGQRRERGVEFKAFGNVVGSAAIGRSVEPFEVGQPGYRTALASAEFIETRIHGDSVRPGAKARSSVEAGESAHDREQGFLGCVGGIGVVPCHAPTDGEDSIVVGSKQAIERAAIARLGVRDKNRVVGRVLDGGTLLTCYVHDVDIADAQTERALTCR
jgi:hypothetical protein